MFGMTFFARTGKRFIVLNGEDKAKLISKFDVLFKPVFYHKEKLIRTKSTELPKIAVSQSKEPHNIPKIVTNKIEVIQKSVANVKPVIPYTPLLQAASAKQQCKKEANTPVVSFASTISFLPSIPQGDSFLLKYPELYRAPTVIPELNFNSITTTKTKTVSHKGIKTIYEGKDPKMVIITTNLNDALAAEKIFICVGAHIEQKDCYEVQLWDEHINLQEIQIHIKNIVAIILVDNDRSNANTKIELIRKITYLLRQGIIVKIAMPQTGKIDDDFKGLTFNEVVNSKQGYSKAAKILNNAIQIEDPKVLDSIKPLQLIFNDLANKKTNPNEQNSFTESLEHRIKSAKKMYENAECTKNDDVIDVNLKLRGITKVPNSFKAAMLSHPDVSEKDNASILQSQDLRIGLLTYIKEEKDLSNFVIEYSHVEKSDNKYWRVQSDFRDHAVLNSKTVDFITIKIQQPWKILTIIIQDLQVIIEGKEIVDPDNTIFVRKFKLYTRLIPYHNERGEITGVERTFFNQSAGKLQFRNRKTKRKVHSKLGRGLLSRAHCIIMSSEDPEIHIMAEGSENLLSAIEALPLVYNSNELKHIYASFCMGTNDLIKIPVQKSSKPLTILLIVDNDGHNMETHQTLINTVEQFLQKGLKVKMVFPIAEVDGDELDLNDVLIHKGIQSVSEILSNAVEITCKKDLGPANELLQFYILLLQLKKQLSISLNNQWLIYYKIGNIYLELKKYESALQYYEKSLHEQTCKKLDHTIEFAKTLHALGIVYSKIGDYDLALNYYEQSNSLKKNVFLSESHKELANTLHRIGELYYLQDQYKLSLSYYIQALKELHAGYSEPCCVEFAIVFQALGHLHFKQEQYPKALNYYIKSLIIQKKVIKKTNHLDIAESLYNIGNVFFKQKNFSKAIFYYNCSIKMLNTIFCNEHHGLDREIIFQIARSLSLKGEYINSLSYYKKFFDLGESYSSTILKLLLSRSNRLLKKPKDTNSIGSVAITRPCLK